MLAYCYSPRRYAVALTPSEEALFQREVDSKPDFDVVDIGTLIHYNLKAEIEVLKERYGE